jgi:hypothetical protein
MHHEEEVSMEKSHDRDTEAAARIEPRSNSAGDIAADDLDLPEAVAEQTAGGDGTITLRKPGKGQTEFV